MLKHHWKMCIKNSIKNSQVWWYTPAIPALGSWRKGESCIKGTSRKQTKEPHKISQVRTHEGKKIESIPFILILHGFLFLAISNYNNKSEIPY
jgi:predicted butyrate kinase (DUF1464 family)